MQLHPEAVGPRRFKHSRGLFAREGDAFTESVDRVCQAVAGHRRDHPRADQIDIRIGAGCFGRQGVSAQKGRRDGDWPAARQGSRGSQQLSFGVDVEAVARFHLDGGHAFGDQGIKARQCRRDEFLFGGLRESPSSWSEFRRPTWRFLRSLHRANATRIRASDRRRTRDAYGSR